MMPSIKPAEVVPLFRSAADEIEEVAVGREILPPAESSLLTLKPPVDLSGAPKIIMAIGNGNTGKTTFLRWLAEVTLERGGEPTFAAVDPENRELKDYFEGVHEPSSYDPAKVAKWLEDMFAHVMANKGSACIDFGGGDTTLGRLVADTPNVVSVLEASGVSPVAIYFLSPRLADLSPLASLEVAGFQPRATALVMNEGRSDPTLPREEAFARTMRHSVFRAAVGRGAVPLWMPRLLPAKEIEDRRVKFGQARDCEVPEGRRLTPLGPFDRARVRVWLERMADSFAPVASWIP